MIFVWYLHVALLLSLLFISLPGEPCLKSGTIAAPPPLPCHPHTYTHTCLESCWEVQADRRHPSPPFHSFPIFPLPFLHSLSPTERDPARLLSVTRVISLCFFIWLRNESNPSAFHCSAAQIMRAASAPLSHTSPPHPPSPQLTHSSPSLPTLLLMDRGEEMCVSVCVSVCLSMWSTQSCQVLCLFSPSWAANEFIVWNLISDIPNISILEVFYFPYSFECKNVSAKHFFLSKFPNHYCMWPLKGSSVSLFIFWEPWKIHQIEKAKWISKPLVGVLVLGL